MREVFGSVMQIERPRNAATLRQIRFDSNHESSFLRLLLPRCSWIDGGSTRIAGIWTSSLLSVFCRTCRCFECDESDPVAAFSAVLLSSSRCSAHQLVLVVMGGANCVASPAASPPGFFLAAICWYCCSIFTASAYLNHWARAAERLAIEAAVSSALCAAFLVSDAEEQLSRFGVPLQTHQQQRKRETTQPPVAFGGERQSLRTSFCFAARVSAPDRNELIGRSERIPFSRLWKKRQLSCSGQSARSDAKESRVCLRKYKRIKWVNLEMADRPLIWRSTTRTLVRLPIASLERNCLEHTLLRNTLISSYRNHFSFRCNH